MNKLKYNLQTNPKHSQPRPLPLFLMARPNQDPLDNLIAQGRVRTRPLKPNEIPTVVLVDLDKLATSLQLRLESIYPLYSKVGKHYLPDDDSDDYDISPASTLKGDIAAMVDFALGVTYNRLREIYQYYQIPLLMMSRMKRQCPICNNLEFPAYLSSVLGCIGPFRLEDGAQDALIVYSTAADHMGNFGRKTRPEFYFGCYSRLVSALKAANIAMSPIDLNVSCIPDGKCFTTISFKKEEDQLARYRRLGDGIPWTLFGTVHRSHYETENVARALLMANPETGRGPFEDFSMTLGYCADEDVVRAIASPLPENMGDHQQADSVGRLVGGMYRVNHHGIELDGKGNPRGVYIIGRGVDPIFTCVLAHKITEHQVLEVLRYRFWGPS